MTTMQNTAVQNNAVAGINDVRTGDIIECDMPSLFDGQIKMINRVCLVVGVEAGRKTEDIHGLVLARFAFPQDRLTEDRGLVIRRNQTRESVMLGLTADAVLRNNRVDLIPADPYYLGTRIRRVGYVRDPQLMTDFAASLMTGLRKGTQGPRGRLSNTNIRQSAKLKGGTVFPDFPLRAVLEMAGTKPLMVDDDYARAEVQRELQRRAECACAFRAAAEALPTCQQQPAGSPAEKLPDRYVTRAEIQHQNRRMGTRQVDQLVTRINAGVRQRQMEGQGVAGQGTARQAMSGQVMAAQLVVT